jgi:hypothetical protein
VTRQAFSRKATVSRPADPIMSVDSSCGTSPSLSELMRLFKAGGNDAPLLQGMGVGSPDDDSTLLPPAPVTAPRANPQPRSQAITRPIERTASVVHTEVHQEMGAHRLQLRASGWNSSTQLAKTAAKPLKHQILCRNFVPSATTAAVDRKGTTQLLERLSKATVSSRMKGAGLGSNGAVVDGGRLNAPKAPIEVDRKRLHLQKRHAAAKQKESSGQDGEKWRNSPRSGREGIELLLFYRKEVEKRLRADPMYALQQDMQP